MRLLEAINSGNLQWNELEGATITKVDEKLSKDGKRYIVDMLIDIENYGNFEYRICGDIHTRDE